MRHFSSSREVRHCRVAARSLILFVMIGVVIFIQIAFLPVLVISELFHWWMIAGMFLVMALAVALSVKLAGRFCCPVCLARPLAFHLADYRNSKGFLVQRKLMTSWQILRECRFRCACCGEWVAVGRPG